MTVSREVAGSSDTDSRDLYLPPPMSTSGSRHWSLRLTLPLVVLALLCPARAHAAVTIAACKADSVTVAGALKLTGGAARRARGATLQLRFQALPLFGLPRSGAWRAAGKRTTGSGQESFVSLPADNWVGVMSWRFKRGSRTVLSGAERSQPARVGRSRGRASCTLAAGAKPPDKTAPALFINPDDDGWHRGQFQLAATDDFSGVKALSYSVDGGPASPIGNRSVITIPGQGAHTVAWRATDVAGNTGTRSRVVKVDTDPPTKPAITRPGPVTSSAAPSIQWTASTDSGSGMRGYVLVIRNSAGAVVSFQTLDAGTTSVASAATLNEARPTPRS